MGMPYGSLPRKTVPREEQDSAMDFSVLFEFGVRISKNLLFVLNTMIIIYSCLLNV